MSEEEIRGWLTRHIAKLLDVSKSAIDDSKSFDELGLDSAAVVSVTGELSEELGFEIDPTFPYDFPNIRLLSERVVESRNIRV